MKTDEIIARLRRLEDDILRTTQAVRHLTVLLEEDLDKQDDDGVV